MNFNSQLRAGDCSFSKMERAEEIATKIEDATVLTADIIEISGDHHVFLTATQKLPRLLISLTENGNICGCSVYGPSITSFLNPYATLDFMSLLHDVLKQCQFTTASCVVQTSLFFQKCLLQAVGAFDKMCNSIVSAPNSKKVVSRAYFV